VQKTTKVIAGSSFRTNSLNPSEKSNLSVKTNAEFAEIIGRRSRSDSMTSDSGLGGLGTTGLGGTTQGIKGIGSTGVRPRVLVCAPSNTAVDELVFRILTQGILDSEGYRSEDINVVRIGHSSKEEYSRKNKYLVFQNTHQSSSTAYHQHTPLTDEDYNIMKIVERVSLESIVEDRRKALLASDGKKQLGISFKYSDIRKQILEKADIVCCTLSGAGSQPILEVILRITGFKFDAVIIDEAAQAVEPSSLIPFKYNPQMIVLVGDPCQLPATVFSRIAKEANYGQSLFLRLQKAGYPVSMLETQYRMHPAIASYPSFRFYANRLLTDEQVVTSNSHRKPYHHDKSHRFKPFLFHDLQYSFEEIDGTSMKNREEAKYVLLLFDELIKRYPEYSKNIGIIAPYRAQRRLLIQLFKQKYGNSCSFLDTEIATVDGFQGREKDIIIFSCVRAGSNISAANQFMNNTMTAAPAAAGGNPNGNPTGIGASMMSNGNSIGFLREWQRLNVAITRAKYALWIVGNSLTLQKDTEWNELIQYAKQQQCLISLFSERMSRIPFQTNQAATTTASSSSSRGNGVIGSSSSSSFQQGNNRNAQSYQRPRSKDNYKGKAKEKERRRETSRDRDRERERDNKDRDRDRSRDRRKNSDYYPTERKYRERSRDRS
jgi:senataxin